MELYKIERQKREDTESSSEHGSRDKEDGEQVRGRERYIVQECNHSENAIVLELN